MSPAAAGSMQACRPPSPPSAGTACSRLLRGRGLRAAATPLSPSLTPALCRQVGGAWRAFCQSFDANNGSGAAGVACRQLGYASGASYSGQYAADFDREPYLWGQLECEGNETSLAQCSAPVRPHESGSVCDASSEEVPGGFLWAACQGAEQAL